MEVDRVVVVAGGRDGGGHPKNNIQNSHYFALKSKEELTRLQFCALVRVSN